MKRTSAVVALGLIILSIATLGDGLPILRFSLPPVLEALPIAFADAWGLFEAHGVDIELVGITDNQQRSVAFSANQLDGLFADVTRAIYDASIGSDILITSAASLRPQTDSIGLAILSHDASFGYATLEELVNAKQPVYTIFRSDYEYILDQYIEGYFGGDARSVRTSYMNDMLAMAVWFGAKTIAAAMLPEPYISYISTYHPPEREPLSLNVLVDLSSLGPPPMLVVFRSKYVKEHPEAIEAFYGAYVEALERINSTPRDVLIDEGIDIALGLFFQGADKSTINQEVLDELTIPYYEMPCTLDQQLYDSVGQWMHDKAYVYPSAPAFDSLVDFQFIR